METLAAWAVGVGGRGGAGGAFAEILKGGADGPANVCRHHRLSSVVVVVVAGSPAS